MTAPNKDIEEGGKIIMCMFVMVIDEETQGRFREFTSLDDFKKAISENVNEDVTKVTIKKRVAKQLPVNSRTIDSV